VSGSAGSGRTALVTGGTRGIGLGVARALAREGWTLAVGGRRPDREVASVIDELRALGASSASGGSHAAQICYVRGDLAQASDRVRVVGEVRARFGAVNALVNNAGRAPRVRADLLDATEESFEEVLRTNLQGPYFLTQAIARDQVARRRDDPSFSASIVFVTSVSAEMASPNRGEYCVSKAGLSMTARLFAARLAGDGIPCVRVTTAASRRGSSLMGVGASRTMSDGWWRRSCAGTCPMPPGRWCTSTAAYRYLDCERAGSLVVGPLRGTSPGRLNRHLSRA